MKLSYKFTIMLLSITGPCTILSIFDYLGNQEGNLYKALPTNVKNFGKAVTLEMSSCPEPSTVKIIYFYKIAGDPTSQNGLMQIIQFQPNKTSQKITLLAPTDQHNANITIEIMPKSVWNLNIKAMQIRANKNATPAQKAEALKLMKESFDGPTNRLNLEYVDIKPKQIIKLPYAATTSPKITLVSQNCILNQINNWWQQLKKYASSVKI